MPQRSAEEILGDIEESDVEEAADKAAAMSTEERRALLREHGVAVEDPRMR